MKPVIVHISGDYPDALQPAKTSAVRSLVDGTADNFRHVVYSLNRVDGWFGIASLPFGEDRTAIAYHALPKGLLWGPRLDALAAWIEADLRARGIRPDLIEAHKFTIEGPIGLKLAEAFGVPLACDIQGDTDTKILAAKKSWHPLYRAIAARAAVVFPYAPWPLPAFQAAIGLDPAKCRVLPVMPLADALSPCPVAAAPRFISVFNLDSWQRKNIVGLGRAVAALAAERPGLAVDAYGRGSPAALIALRHALGDAGVAGQVNLCGPVPNGDLNGVMKRYTAFALPSRRETYGLVYAEALFAGLPVLFGRKRGIDGIFAEAAIGCGCDPQDVDDVARGLRDLLAREAALKDSIAALQSAGGLDRIRRAAILDVYRAGLGDALTGGATPA